MTGPLQATGAAVHDVAAWCAAVAREVGASQVVAGVVVAAGLLVLLFGARARRPIAALGAAGLGAIAAGVLRSRLGSAADVSPTLLAVAGAGMAGALAALVPLAFPAIAGALPAALAAEILAPAENHLVALAIGAVAGAAVGILLARLVASLAAAAAGAVAVTVGVAGALHATAVGKALLGHPVSLLAVVVLLTVSGAAFQFPRAWGRGNAAPGKLETPRRLGRDAAEGDAA